jgi:hypothetical protein
MWRDSDGLADRGCSACARGPWSPGALRVFRSFGGGAARSGDPVDYQPRENGFRRSLRTVISGQPGRVVS